MKHDGGCVTQVPTGRRTRRCVTRARHNPAILRVVADDIDDLYALPPEEFTAARDALAKELRAGGDKDTAAAVKKLARPTVAAWALNQLPRRHPDAVTALLDAGAELRRAQRRALSGIKDAGMSRASALRREAVMDAARLAAGILEDAGKSPQTVEREISDALEAASADPETGEQLQEGRFAKPPQPSGELDPMAALSLMVSATEEEKAPPAKPKAEQQREDREAKQKQRREKEIAEARTAATRASQAAVEAEEVATQTRAAAAEAHDLAEELRRRADDAARTARDLERRAKDAEAEAGKRRDAAKKAADKLSELERE